MRKAEIKRKTAETDIRLKLNLDGEGKYSVKTDIPFLSHMLELFAKHGSFDLEITATGDVDVDHHHLIEDVGIVLGEAFRRALGDKKGIKRYGSFLLPMDETLVMTAVDLSGRPYFVYNNFPEMKILNGIEFDLWREFWKSFSFSLKCNLHLNLFYGLNLHHIVEASFKAVAKSLKEAVSIDEKLKDSVPSTKGVI
ncbi:imidazoleglycerol-phosphate dehydratase HisB [Desulfurobacterium indicum]|uniref:Imidazoleglycerol-phosphate dehydratase n=1 Tax=Desulfurobacterium indicum TaxID=1914305 RepID=A0A1R1MK62_9BACT|nr:imidazoleglycerol-phosphate dehydratase HisB [Desulfurobacterium indicum]OMH40202.1 imidazoleglycerol-phosphate dehydratase [Desulfurobacterium indicum]